MAKGEIRIHCHSGERTVEAEVFGDFAVHEEASGRDLWAVTHIPSGLAACCVPRKADARSLARYLRDNLSIPKGLTPLGVHKWVIEHRADLREISERVWATKGAEPSFRGSREEVAAKLQERGAA